MQTAITAIGTANPPYKRCQPDTAEIIIAGLNMRPAEKRLLRSVYKATGIQHRHSVLSDYCKNPGEFTFFPNDPGIEFPTTAARMKVYKDSALPLALSAIKNCLASRPDFDKNTITHVITISCTGMYAPGLDIEIVQELELQRSVKRTCVNFMGCYGTFNGLKLADAICKAEPNAKVLLVSVELCTIHFQKNMNMDNIISNAIFSDGAGAVLVERKIDALKHLSLQDFHCDLLPQTDKAMAWHIGDSGFDIVLSSYVPDVIQSGIAEFMQNLLAKQEFFQQVDIYAIHPGGLKILQACEVALNITEQQNSYSYGVLRDYGNMSSATILFVLKAIWDDMEHHHQKNIFGCAFGPGLTLESIMLKTNNI